MLIPKRIIEGVPKLASKDETRAALASVLLEREGELCRATATNGHALITATWRELDALDFPELPDGSLLTWGVNGFKTTVKALALAAVAKALPKRLTNEAAMQAALLEDPAPNGSGTMVAGATAVKVPTNEGEFPDYRQIMPTDRTDVRTVGMNAVLLRDTLNAIIAAADNKERVGVTIDVPAPDAKYGVISPVLIRHSHVESGGEIEALIMPMRL